MVPFFLEKSEMQVKVYCGTGKFPKLIESMTLFLVKHFKIKNSRFNLVVLPLFKRENREGNRGCVEHDEKTITLKLKMYDVNEYDLRVTIAHEMVHVRQICRGLLKDLPPGRCTWRGRKYYVKKTPYLKRPWELQALREQDYLAILFKQFTSVRKKNRIGRKS